MGTSTDIGITAKGAITSCNQVSSCFESFSPFGYNVDNASCCVIAIKDAPPSSPYDLNSLYPFKRNLSPINTTQIDLVDPSSIYQYQCIGRSRLSKTTQVNSKTLA